MVIAFIKQHYSEANDLEDSIESRKHILVGKDRLHKLCCLLSIVVKLCVSEVQRTWCEVKLLRTLSQGLKFSHTLRWFIIAIVIWTERAQASFRNISKQLCDYDFVGSHLRWDSSWTNRGAIAKENRKSVLTFFRNFNECDLIKDKDLEKQMGSTCVPQRYLPFSNKSRSVKPQRARTTTALIHLLTEWIKFFEDRNKIAHLRAY